LAQAKLGWAQDDWLIFAQAGYAGANNKLNLNTTVTGFNSDSDTAWHNGFTFGGGVAYRFGSWSLSLDYNYIELEKSLYSFSANGTPADKVSVEIKGHISKAAVNFHF
jgi:opacity protein-like surface antigen